MNKFYDNIEVANSNVPEALQGNAVNFNGVDHLFHLTGYDQLEYTTPFIILASYKSDDNNRNECIVSSMSDYNPSSSNAQFHRGCALTHFSPTSTDYFYVYQKAGNAPFIRNQVNTSICPTNQYNTIICVNTGAVARQEMLSNGAKIFNTAFTENITTIVNDANSLTVGNFSPNGLASDAPASRYYFKGAIKRIEIVLGSFTNSQLRRAYNQGTMEGIAAPADFHVNLDGDSYNPATGIWTDTSPNGYVFNAQGATNPTQSTFI